MKDKKEMRRRMFDEMEQKLKETYSEEERMFYYHPSEERVVLSHALFWVMSGSLKGRIRQEKYLLLLRQYEEEMLDALDVHFSCEEKRNQRDIHLTKPSLYGRM